MCRIKDFYSIWICLHSVMYYVYDIIMFSDVYDIIIYNSMKNIWMNIPHKPKPICLGQGHKTKYSVEVYVE